MADKKALLANFLHASGLNYPISFLQDLIAPGVRILAYHRVMNYEEESYPFDLELISATPEKFRYQVDFLKKHYSPMSFAELAELTEKGIRPPKNAIIITFDDGFSDNYEFAFPILKEANVPATIFISTNYIDGEDTFWFDQLAYAVKKQHATDIKFEFKGKEFNFPASNSEAKETCLKETLAWIKKVPDNDRLNFLRNLKSHIQVESANAHLSKPMTWEQIKELDAGGIEIASHTCSHPILSQLSENELISEIFESKQKIEDTLGKPCTAISYPVGVSHTYNQVVTDAVKKAGYVFGCTYESGINKVESLSKFPLHLQRNAVERYTTDPLFTSTLALPSIFG